MKDKRYNYYKYYYDTYNINGNKVRIFGNSKRELQLTVKNYIKSLINTYNNYEFIVHECEKEK